MTPRLTGKLTATRTQAEPPRRIEEVEPELPEIDWGNGMPKPKTPVKQPDYHHNRSQYCSFFREHDADGKRGRYCAAYDKPCEDPANAKCSNVNGYLGLPKKWVPIGH